MNAISYAISRIKQQIPQAVLKATFNDSHANNFAIAVSTDSKIREEVINNRVMVDCNLVGGAEVTIALRNCRHERVQPSVHVYTIPKDLTQGRTIISALSVAFANGGIAGNMAPYGVANELDNAAKMQVAAISSIPYVSDARCSVIGENVVLIEHPDMTVANLYLRCVIENDSHMQHLNAKSWPNFAKLCVLACKAEIYNRNVIQVDMGKMVGGQELGAYKDTIDSYSDMQEMYEEFLTTVWSKTAIMNDPQQRQRLIRITSMNRP